MRYFSLLILLTLTTTLSFSFAEEGEVSANVGPDKGIIESDEHEGFKLSSEALKNFEIKSVKLRGRGPWEIPQSAIVTSGEETNLFRIRNSFFSRIDFQLIRATGTQSSMIKSRDLQEGDEIVIAGVGFLRVAEISISGGLEHGHSH